MAMKFDNKAIRNAETCKKTSPKNKQILIKTINPQVFKKTRKSTKKQAHIRGKTENWRFSSQK